MICTDEAYRRSEGHASTLQVWIHCMKTRNTKYFTYLAGLISIRRLGILLSPLYFIKITHVHHTDVSYTEWIAIKSSFENS